MLEALKEDLWMGCPGATPSPPVMSPARLVGYEVGAIRA